MDKIGSVIDNRYEITQYINKGGMSAVYLAVNTRLGNRWAVKEIKKTNDVNNDIYINSLIVEANIMKNFDHPAFPRIVDIVDTDEALYLVMDFIEGKTLDQILKEYGPQNENTVTNWMIEICNAISYLHHQNPPIIYRDMKPSNVMLKPNGAIKIIDFGVARVFNPSKNTDTVVMGTRGFAPPEQFAGHTDIRSDIYAIGMTMFYLLTGIGPNSEEFYSHSQDDLMSSVSPAMRAIVKRCISANPIDRYQNCEELLRDLNNLKNNPKKSGKKSVSKAAILIPVIATLVAAAAAAAILIAINANKDTGTKEQQITTAAATTIESTAAATTESDIVVVPDTVGMKYEEAKSTLEKAGFEVKSEEEYNDDVEYGVVIKQSVDGGKKLSKKAAITITVSKGKESDNSSSESEYNDNSGDSGNSGNSGNSGGSGSGFSNGGGYTPADNSSQSSEKTVSSNSSSYSEEDSDPYVVEPSDYDYELPAVDEGGAGGEESEQSHN